MLRYNILKIICFVLIVISAKANAASLKSIKDEISKKKGEEQLLLLESHLNALHRDSIHQKEVLIRFTIKQLKKEDKYFGRMYLKLADILLEKQEFVYAFDTIFLAKDLMAEAEDSIGRGYYYNLVGRYYYRSANFDKSILYFDSSVICFKKNSLFLDLANAYNSIGTSFFSIRDLFNAIKYYKEAKRVFLQLNNKRGVYMMSGNLSLVYKNAKMLDEAITNMEEEIRLEKELNIEPEIYPTLYNRADMYHKANRFIEAKNVIEPAYTKLSIFLFGSDKPNLGPMPKIIEKYPDEVYQLGLFAKRLSAIKESLGEKGGMKLMNVAYWSIVYFKNIELAKRANMISSVKEKYSLEKKNLETELALSKAKSNAYEQRILLVIVIAIGLIVSLSLGIYYRSNKKLEERNHLIEKQQENIVDSINYASRIQDSILFSEEKIGEYLSGFFVFYRPRDIVSGDFYWFGIVNNIQIIAAIDCTGHGVPGAFMSMIGNTLLNEIILEKKITDPGEILNCLHDAVVSNLHQDQEGVNAQDGMDLSLCSIDIKNKEIKYAGAKNPLYLVRNNLIEEIKGDPFSIGGMYKRLRKTKIEKRFVSRDIPYSKGLYLYLFTDGYIDQFGAEDKKVFNSKRFKNTLLSINDLSPIDKKSGLAKVMDEWKRDTKQIDDMLVLGFRV